VASPPLPPVIASNRAAACGSCSTGLAGDGPGGQRGHEMDVIQSVPDRDPPHAQVVVLRGEAGPVHDVRRGLAPTPHPTAVGLPERLGPSNATLASDS
jgi:hypothetical protein